MGSVNKPPGSNEVWEIQSPIIRNLEGEDCSNNDTFDIHVFIPDSFQEIPEGPDDNSEEAPIEEDSSSPHHFLIMVNGLAEYNDSVYLGKKGLCELFRQIGIASVFLPLPFHFNRLSDADQEALAAEKKERHGPGNPFKHPDVGKILDDHLRFYFGYEQIREDILLVTKRIIDSIKSGNLPEDTRISLWGFSIGGLGILSTYLENPDAFEYDSCFLVHSGANFKTLGFNEAILTEKQWRRLQDKLLNEPLFQGRAANIYRREYEMFKMLFIGEESEKLKKIISDYSNRILIFIGEEDDVNSLASVISTLRPNKGLAMHTLPGLRHDNVNKSFRRWVDYEARVCKAFLDHHPEQPT